MTALIDRLEAAIREHILAEMPDDPSLELTETELRELLTLGSSCRTRVSRLTHSSSMARDEASIG
jgi:hypothetical protein